MAGAGQLDPVDVIIGKLALDQRLVDEGQLAEARMHCSMDASRTLAQVLYGLGYLSIQQAERLEHAAMVMRTREEDKLLCELAVKRKIITAPQAEEVLQVQKNAARNPGQLPRVKELLVNREYVKGPMIDILLDLVRQVSPYSKSDSPPEPPRPPPGRLEGAARTSSGDTGRKVKGEEEPMPPPGGKVDGAARPSSGDTGKVVKSDEKPQFFPPGSNAAARLAELRKLRTSAAATTETASKSRPEAALPGPERPGGWGASSKPPERPPAKPASAAPAQESQGRKQPDGGDAPEAQPARLTEGSIFTRAVRGGEFPDSRPTIDPIVPSVAFDFESVEQLEDFLRGKPGFWYSRHGNPTVRACEERIASLEGAEDAALAASGLGAITATLLTLLKPGDSIALTDGLYGGTWHLLNDVLAEFNITVRRIPAKDWLLIREQLSGTTKLVYFEPMTNPMLRLWDPRPAATDAKRFGILTMVDNTFATPVNFRPLEHGIDIVFHSCTKYLNGHSDVTAGVVCGRKDLVGRIRERMKLLGPTLSAFDAWLLARGLKTFPLRMKAHNENALYIARALEKFPGVKRVWYPGLESHPDRILAKWMLPAGHGGVVTLEVDGGLPAAKAFMNKLKLCHRAVSLGGVETLVSLPILSSHWQIPQVELDRQGIPQGAVRISVGIEDAQDILADLQQALT